MRKSGTSIDYFSFLCCLTFIHMYVYVCTYTWIYVYVCTYVLLRKGREEGTAFVLGQSLPVASVMKAFHVMSVRNICIYHVIYRCACIYTTMHICPHTSVLSVKIKSH